jgi:D-alanine-D-alanine ligase
MAIPKMDLKKRKTSVAVLCGGSSSEHEVSLASGRHIFEALDRDKFNPELIIWERTDTPPLSLEQFRRFDVVFIAMHGSFGEDGTVQAFLELSGVPYTGSGAVASRLGMDKVASKLLFQTAGIPTPEYRVAQEIKQGLAVLEEIGFPCVIKPSAQGSSVGVSVAEERQDFVKAFPKAVKFDGRVVIERYIKGREFSCGILGNGNPTALPLAEIIPKARFFNYAAKYNSGMAEETIPARLDRGMTRAMQQLAIKVYEILGCRGFGRVDMLLSENGIPYVLEINTIPGMTGASLLPKEAGAAGIGFSQLVERIINLSLEQRNQVRPNVINLESIDRSLYQ